MDILKQSSTSVLVFPLIASTDHISPATGLAPTVLISKAGGAFAAPAGTVSEIGNGWYKFVPTSADTGTLGYLVLHATAGGADPTDATYLVVAFDPADDQRLGLAALAAANTPVVNADGSMNINMAQPIPTSPAAGSIGRFLRSVKARLVGRAPTPSGDTETFLDDAGTTALSLTYDNIGSPTQRTTVTES